MFNNPAIQNLALLVGRIMLAAIYVLSGYNKIGGFAGTQKFMESQGVPGMFLPLVIITELGFGLMVLVGFGTRIAAFMLAASSGSTPMTLTSGRRNLTKAAMPAASPPPPMGT